VGTVGTVGAVGAAGACQSRQEAGTAVRTSAGNRRDASAGAGVRTRDNACTDMAVRMDAQGYSLSNTKTAWIKHVLVIYPLLHDSQKQLSANFFRGSISDQIIIIIIIQDKLLV